MSKRNRMGNSAVAIGYVRRSTLHQDNSIEVQARAIARWCADQGIVLGAVFFDSVSRSTPVDERPGLVAALVSLRELGAGCVVVQKRDRMSDGAVIADAFEIAARSNGAVVHDTEGASAEDGVAGVINRGMRDLMSQVEIAQIRARTKAALAVKRARGERVGMVPYGYAVDADGSRLVPLASEQAVLTLVQAMSASGYRICDIVDALLKQGIVGRTGRALARTQVVNMLARLPVAA